LIDPATIITLLAGGAIAKLGGLGGDLVADAYAGLKQILIDGYGFAAGRLLETAPKDSHTREIVEKDIPPNAVQDTEVVLRAQKLEAALATISEENWRAAGVLIEGLTAHRTIEIGKVTGGARAITIRNLRAEEGDVKIGDVQG
jgi:hypothetical protein